MYAWDEPGSPEDYRPDPPASWETRERPRYEDAEDAAARQQDEDIERERWERFQGDILNFVDAEGGGADGWAAVLRAVSRAMSQQQELFK